MGSEDESIEQKSAARKEALRALRAAKELSESKEEGEGDDSAAVEQEWVCFVLFLVYLSRALYLQSWFIEKKQTCQDI